ncbi:hypothetical protein DACRYDRAFT_22211, partial [Dacryopinax primogenitus]
MPIEDARAEVISVASSHSGSPALPPLNLLIPGLRPAWEAHPFASMLSADQHYITTDDERVLDELSAASRAARAPLPRTKLGARGGGNSSVQVRKDAEVPVSGERSREIMCQSGVLDFTVIRDQPKLILQLRLTNHSNNKPTAFKLYHSANEEQRKKLKVEHNCFPTHMLDQYSRIISLSPRVGVIHPMCTADITGRLITSPLEACLIRR